MSLFRSSFIAILAFTLLCIAATWFALGGLGLRFTTAHATIAAWFFGVSVLLHMWQERELGGDIKRFMRRFMAGLVLKLLASLILAAVLMFAVKDDRKALMIVFVLWYLAFLGFSTARLVMLLRSANTQRP